MKGTYVLLIKLPANEQIKIGKLGAIQFKSGTYAYVGSALNNLEKRVERHLRSEKKLQWHIDYLLKEAEVISVIYGESSQRKECEIARNLAKTLPSLRGFGASDCKCESHLFYSELEEVEDRVIESFKLAGLEPERWQ